MDIEACGGAHHWAREIGKLGHQVRIIAPQFVSPYRKSGKNDANDAEAICEAVARPNMRFVAIKAPEQQAALVVHRAREAIKAERAALINQIRGLLQDLALSCPQGAATFSKQLVEVLEDSGCLWKPWVSLPSCVGICYGWRDGRRTMTGGLRGWLKTRRPSSWPRSPVSAQ